MLKEKYALTDEGVRNVKLGTVWTALANLIIFMGIGLLYVLMDALVAGYTQGASMPSLFGGLPQLASLGFNVPFVILLVAFFVLLLPTTTNMA